MVKQKPVIIILLLISIAIVVFLFIRGSEEWQVRKRFRDFAETASISEDESPLIVAAKSKKISRFFSENCQIEADEYNVSKSYTQKDIHTIAFKVLNRYSDLKLRFIDLQIEITEEGTAHAVSTARIVGKVKGDAEYLEETHEIDCRLKKSDDAWVFVEVELVDVLEK